MRGFRNSLPLAAAEELWTAPSAAQWAACLSRSRQPANLTLQPTEVEASNLYSGFLSSDSLVAYVKLADLNASINESHRSDALSPASSDQFQDSLIKWYREYSGVVGLHHQDTLCLMVLWHSIFMSLCVDFARLGISCGKDGFLEAEDHLGYIRSWAASRAAKRCVLHGTLVLRWLRNSSLGSEFAIHVPRVLFQAALAWYSYTHFGEDDSSQSPVDDLNYPELNLLGLNGTELLFEANGYKISRPSTLESATLYNLVDLLKRISHWGISSKFASILTLLVHGTPEGSHAQV